MRLVALAAVAITVAASWAGAAAPSHRFENRVAGYTIAIPPGWHASVLADDRSVTIATYRARAGGNISARPPRGETWLRLYDYGELWTLPWSRRFRPLPAQLPPVGAYEGFGAARAVQFSIDRHAFFAFVKGVPRGEVLRILASIRITAYGRSLADLHTMRVVGRSVEGHRLRVWRIGNPRSTKRILVVGCIHGDECAGMAITAQLVDLGTPIPLDLWVVQDLNPDGLAAGTRQNAHGVDLNRNFGAMWRPMGSPGSPEYPGPRPWSERETRIARGLVARIRPDVTIWFHQPQGLVRAWGRSVPLARRYAKLARVPFRALPWLNGTAPNWQNHRGEVSFVVELPPGALSPAAASRYANAILRLVD